jgi:hypothetical protein
MAWSINTGTADHASSIDARRLSLRAADTTDSTTRTDESLGVSMLLLTALVAFLPVALLGLRTRIDTTVLGIIFSPPPLVGVMANASVTAVTLEITLKANTSVTAVYALEGNEAASEPDDVDGPLRNSSVSCIADSKILPPVLGPLMCQSTPYRPRLKSCVYGCSAASKKSSPFIVRPCGGLANRLRVITSYLVLARETSRRLVIQWSMSAYRGSPPSNFSELFQISSLPQDIEIDESFSEKPEYIGTGPYGGKAIAVPRRDGPLLLASLVPLPELAVMINALLYQLGCGSFLAMHVRRTDLNSNYDADIEFVKWANEQPSLPVFLATDNNRTLHFIRQKLGSRLVSQDDYRSPPGSQRFASIQSGLIDMVR